MGLWQPEQLVWLVLSAAVLVLYLGVRRRTVDVSSHLIWRRAEAGLSPWRRWQRVFSAGMLMVLISSLAVVLAEPYWKRDRAAARTMVVVLDSKAGEGSAAQAALKAVDNMQLYERMAIVAASHPTRVLCPFTDDRAQLTQAIDRGPPAGTRSLDSGKRLAEWMVAGEPNPVVIVASEAQSGAASQRPDHPSRVPPGAWVLAGAVALCATEWLLFTRRVTV
jgi:hypothetical protein